MSRPFYQIHCEICGYKKKTDGTDVKLVEYKRSKIQTNIPKMEDGKFVVGKDMALPKTFKCPSCGRLVRPKKIGNPYENNDKGNKGSSQEPKF